jgi:hypothetical protein
VFVPAALGAALAFTVCIADPYAHRFLSFSIRRIDLFRVWPYVFSTLLVLVALALLVLIRFFNALWTSERFRLGILILATQIGFLRGILDPFYGIGLVVLCVFMFRTIHYRETVMFPRSFVYPLTFLFLAMVWLSLINGVNQNTLRGFYIAFWTIGVWVFLLINHIKTRDDFFRAIDLLCWATIFASIVGIIQFFAYLFFHVDLTINPIEADLGPSESRFERTPWGVVNRAAGFFANPNYYGAFLGAVIVIVFLLALIPGLERWKRRLYLVTWALGCAGLILSFSRTSWFGVAGAVLLMPFFLWPHRSIHYGLLILLIVSVGFASGFFQSLWLTISTQFNPGAVEARQEIYSLAIEAFKRHPFTGVGVNAFDFYPGNVPHYKAHNCVLQLLSEIGLLGAVVFHALFALVFYRLFRAWLGAPDRVRRVVFAAVLLGVLSYFIHAQFDILVYGNILWFCVALEEISVFLFAEGGVITPSVASETSIFGRARLLGG